MDSRLKDVFKEILDEPDINDDSTITNTEKWDSSGHVALILALEDRFGITFEDEEIIELISIKAIEDALGKRGIDL